MINKVKEELWSQWTPLSSVMVSNCHIYEKYKLPKKLKRKFAKYDKHIWNALAELDDLLYEVEGLSKDLTGDQFVERLKKM